MEPASSGQGIIGQNYYSEYIFSYFNSVHSNEIDMVNKQRKNASIEMFLSSNNNLARFCLNE